MMLTILTISLGGFLAFANGANDNFKGVGTIFGSGIASFRKSLAWATVTTFAGSAVAIALAGELLKSFSGKGLVPDTVFQNPVFGLSVSSAAAVTVLLASRVGLPVSTTHAITGALVGAGLSASGSGINWARLGNLFVLPLLASPVVATLLAVVFQKITSRPATPNTSEDACLCVTQPNAIASGVAGADFLVSEKALVVGNSSDAVCANSDTKISATTLSRTLHFLSAGVVSFARGVNDTPKIAALLLTTGALANNQMIMIVATLMAMGGILYSRRVAETISKKITTLTEREGLVANLTTSVLVLSASRFGLPVSTTHVSTGALFGIGAGSGHLRWDTLRTILLAWVATLPLAGLISALAFIILKEII